MALSANKNRDFRPGNGGYVKSFIVKNGVTVYQGSLVGIDRTSGHVFPWTVETGQDNIFLGVAKEKVVGDGVLVVGVICTGVELVQVAVTGVTAVTDTLKPVYLTDDDTLTLSAPAAGKPVGQITKWYSSTTCDVRLRTPIEYADWGAI